MISHDSYHRPRSEEGFPENFLATEEDALEAARNIAEMEKNKERNAAIEASLRREAAQREERLDALMMSGNLYNSNDQDLFTNPYDIKISYNEEEGVPGFDQQHQNDQQAQYNNQDLFGYQDEYNRRNDQNQYDHDDQYDQLEKYEQKPQLGLKPLHDEQPQYDDNQLYQQNNLLSDSTDSESDSDSAEDSEDEYVASPEKKSGRAKAVAKRGQKRAPLKSVNKNNSAPAPSRRGRKRAASSNDSSSSDQNGDGEIDTKETAIRINVALKNLSIPQTAFAAKVLGRSQGTLSDLLRNPKPWKDLKSGKDTFRRMHQFLQLSEKEMIAVCQMEVEAARTALGLPAPTPKGKQKKPAAEKNKKPRLVFSDIQKRTLGAIFDQTERPSREMQSSICDHLKLDLNTVTNYFMNARRRSRIHQPDVPSTSSDF